MLDNAQIESLYEEQEDNEEYRDHLATVDEKGKRIWVYPKKPKGRYHNRRVALSIFLLAFLVGSPFIKVGENPFLLFDFFERKFILFGQVFWPQDFHLFAIGFIASIVFIILFTVVYGRLFCGWICPQTIFMEMVFRKIEYLIEGDYMAQKKLDKMPWNQEKIVKKTLKQLIFIFISFLIMHTFIAWIVGVDGLWEIMLDGPMERPGGFLAMLIFTGLFYGVFGHFREQVCTQVCPYGRLQGVLLDKQSIVVAYDYKRGEERAKFRKNEDREAIGKGDCIDCRQCVYVCPTAIDIRNGTQLECINCTACIDACDDIMDKVNRPRGLIRYASEANLSENEPSRFTARMKGYTVLLVLLLVLLTSLLMIRSDVETSILRTPGMTYQERDDGTISNLYNIKVINKTSNTLPIRLELKANSGRIEWVGDKIVTPPSDVAQGAIFVVFDKRDVKKRSSMIYIDVFSGDEKLETVKTKFLGPINYN